MTYTEYVALHGREPFDSSYWGPAGVNLSRWGNECRRGLQYHDHGVERAEPGQRRGFGGGRKARGYASLTSGED